MPYITSKRKDGKFCNYKQGEDGKPEGESLACFDSLSKAHAQLRALYANEGKSLIMADELKAMMKKESDGAMHPKDHYLVAGETVSDFHLRIKDKQGKLSPRLMGAAHAALTVGYRGNKYAGPDKEKALAKLKKLYKQMGMKWPEDKAEKSISIWDLENKVRGAIRTKLMEATGADDEWDMPYYSCDIFLDFAIVKAPAGLYQIEYSIAPESYEITLGEPQKVKIEYVPDDAPEEDIADMEDEAYAEMLKKSADLTVIKALGENRVGSYAVLWGDEAKKDLTGEFFDQKTEELTTIFEAVGKLPYLYHHGLDETLKTAVIGVVDTLIPDTIGLWYEAQLRMASEYEEAVKKLFSEKKLKTSTQTFPVARRVGKNGHIDRWPIVEITATPTPAEYRMQPVETLKGAFTEIGYADIASVFKAKLGIDGDGSTQGAEKARMLKELELAEIELLDF